MNTQLTFTEAVASRRLVIEKRAVINSTLDVIIEAIKYADSQNSAVLLDDIINFLSHAESNIYANITNYESRQKEVIDASAVELP